jgi:type IV fimbrial biogenesis protein FimT
MTAIAVAAILMVVAIPNLLSFVRSDTLTTNANNLVFALNYARNQAVKLDSVVSLCPSSDGASCIAASTSWANGWIAFTGASTAPVVLQVWPGMPGGFTLVTKVYTVTSSVSPINFQPSGLTSATSAIEFILCDPRGPKYGIDMELLPTGRTETSTTPGYSVYTGGTGTGTALTTCS